MSSPSSYLALSQRLTSTSSLLLERSRVISLNLPPSASSQNQIVRNLTLIKADLDKLQDQAQLESSGLSVGGSGSGSGGSARGKGKKAEGQAEKQLRELGEQYDRLVEMLAEDAIGKEKAKSLRREKPAPQPEPVHEAPQAPAHGIGEDSDDETLPRLNVEPPTPMDRTGITPFKDYPDDYEPEEERTSREMLDQQQVMMDDQDERLNLLSHSIGRQNHLAIEIGSELDIHHELLEDTDHAMDRTAARLGSARRRLDRVASDAKQHGSTITIVGLILILLILIIVFKT